jgi:hypothetical protein
MKSARSSRQLSDALALNRVAIGFRLAENPSIRLWPNHPGYSTAEGRELNETAIDAGDDPKKWYVSEEPIDLLRSVEFWSSRAVIEPRLRRLDHYLKDMHNMVRTCRARKDVFIPPTWLTTDEARTLSAMMDLPAISGDADLKSLPDRTDRS